MTILFFHFAKRYFQKIACDNKGKEEIWTIEIILEKGKKYSEK
jgi:hypothetical protein